MGSQAENLPVLIQMSVLTAALVIFIGLMGLVVKQIIFIRQRKLSFLLHAIILNALFWGSIAFLANLVSLTFYPDDCIHHIVAATSHGICTWSVDALLILKSVKIVKSLVSRTFLIVFCTLCLMIWVPIVGTFITYNIVQVKYQVIPNIICLPFFPSELAVIRGLEIFLSFLTTVAFVYTIHINTRNNKRNAVIDRINRLKIKSAASAIVCCMFIVVAAALLTTDGQKPEWGPYNITVIVIEMTVVGLCLVYSNHCEMHSDKEQDAAASSIPVSKIDRTQARKPSGTFEASINSATY